MRKQSRAYTQTKCKYSFSHFRRPNSLNIDEILFIKLKITVKAQRAKILGYQVKNHKKDSKQSSFDNWTTHVFYIYLQYIKKYPILLYIRKE